MDGVASSSGIGSLYLHVPFCARKCAYCDFASEATTAGDSRMDAYLADRLGELTWCAERGLLDACTTAYVGGGTPTFLGARRLGALVRAVRDACSGLQEFSCEANPDSLTDETLRVLVDSGVTRLSIGVQSLDDDELEALGRIHTAAQALDRMGAAVDSGLDVSVDLMCAIPLQTPESWRRTLDEVVSLGINHVSVYPLAIEDGTVFARRYAHEDTSFNDEDVQAERMEAAERVLQAAGLSRYEVASYARPGKHCTHNIAYWTGVEYLGLGRGAASMLAGRSYDEVRGLYRWLPDRPDGAARMRFSTLDCEVEFLSEREAWAEDLMLGMRLTRGIAASALDDVPAVRDELLERGLIAYHDDRLVPTHDGWLLGNDLFSALWDLAS